jgi:hypothetical protein
MKIMRYIHVSVSSGVTALIRADGGIACLGRNFESLILPDEIDRGDLIVGLWTTLRVAHIPTALLLLQRLFFSFRETKRGQTREATSAGYQCGGKEVRKHERLPRRKREILYGRTS